MSTADVVSLLIAGLGGAAVGFERQWSGHAEGNVTFTMARTSRTEPAMDRALALGAVGASAMVYPRVLVATAILNRAVVAPLLPYLIPPAVVATLVAALGLRRLTKDVARAATPAVAATAIAVGVLTNTLMKLALALSLGSRRFKMIAGGALGLMLLALGVALLIRFP